VSCDYCLGYEGDCTCETDCGTAGSWIGPCPVSPQGIAMLQTLIEQGMEPELEVPS
jgi:hypothetical protein